MSDYAFRKFAKKPTFAWDSMEGGPYRAEQYPTGTGRTTRMGWKHVKTHPNQVREYHQFNEGEHVASIAEVEASNKGEARRKFAEIGKMSPARREDLN